MTALQKKVQALPRTLKIHVSREDIKRGRRANAERCPIARAVRRKTKIRGVWVGSNVVLRNRDYLLPSNAVDFINAFDGDQLGLSRHIRPFSFTMTTGKS